MLRILLPNVDDKEIAIFDRSIGNGYQAAQSWHSFCTSSQPAIALL